MPNEYAQLTPSASTILDDDATSFDASNWRGGSDTDRWAQSPSMWRKDPSFEFRVRCESQPNRRLRLAGTRYTLGSGVGCSIRLEDPSLRPLHAVLIRDHERIFVRAYSVPLYINGVRTSEGVLDTGDRLRLGIYEFELLESSPRPVDAISQAVAHRLVGSDGHVDSRGGESNQDWSRSFHEEAKQWRALKQDVQRRDAWCQTRERELLEQQKMLQQKLDLLQNREEELQTQESAAVEVHEEFQRRYNELLRHREELQLQQEELTTGREHLRLQQERLDGRDRLHRQQIDKLLSEQEKLKGQETLTQQKLAESDERVHASRRQAEAATTAVEQMREKFTSLHEQLAQLTLQQETLQKLESERTRELSRRCEDLAFDREEAESQRDEVAVERDRIANQRDQVTAQRDQIASERDALAAQCDELATQRDASLDAQATSEAAHTKLAARCDQLESIEAQRRDEIVQLQSEIARIQLDAESLDKDCRVARRTITNLEHTIQENQQQYESDRESWTVEVDALRENLEALSIDLAGAQAQLSKLGDENDRLADQLTGAHAERDEARAEREEATLQCELARRECDTAKMECEAARRELASARDDVKRARQERDDAAAQRDAVIAQREELISQHDQLDQELGRALESEATLREQWNRQQENAELRYQEAQTHLADARHKCEQAVRTRDDAETARLAAEAKLENATQELVSMQAQRDLAIGEQENLRRQRDSAVQDAANTRQLFDRSNRDHDETLDRIEQLERKTRQAIAAPELASATKLARVLRDAELHDPRCDEDQHPDLEAGASEHPSSLLSSPTLEPESESEPTPEPTPAQWAVEPPTALDDEDDVWPMYSSSEPVPIAEIGEEAASQSLSDSQESASMPAFDHRFHDDQIADDVADQDAEEIDLAAASTPDEQEWVAAHRDAEPMDDSVESVAESLPTWPEESHSCPLPNHQLQEEQAEQSLDEPADEALEEEPHDEALPVLLAPSLNGPTPAALEETSATAMWNARSDWNADDEADPSESFSLSEREPVAEHTDDDDSIEAYMNRLLQRVQGQSGSNAPQKPAEKTNPVSESATKLSLLNIKTTEISSAQGNETSDDSEESPAGENVDLDAPLVPRSQAPERNSDLSAMRGLANASARSAITRSQKSINRTTRVQAMVKFSQAGIAMVCGIAAVVLVELSMLKTIAALAALIIAGICVREGFSLLADLSNRANSSPATAPAPATATTDAPASQTDDETSPAS